MKPQPIETAPKDGTTILTDCGFARYLDQRHYWGSPVKDGTWVECRPDGDVYRCADEGNWYCNPKLWIPVPAWIPQ